MSRTPDSQCDAAAGDEFAQAVEERGTHRTMPRQSGGWHSGVLISDVSCCACVVVFETIVYMFMVCCSLLNIVLLSLFWRLPSRGGRQNRKNI
jgi:hypothetical protein